MHCHLVRWSRLARLNAVANVVVNCRWKRVSRGESEKKRWQIARAVDRSDEAKFQVCVFECNQHARNGI